MDFTSIFHKSEPHKRTIIHLDMDYFYAQVEEIRNPKLRTVPLGIQQKNIVVTCNYVARAHGVRKLMLITEAQHICPELVLVNGEDLTPYRQMSQKIHDLLLNYTPNVEKLGFDENYMDISRLVELRQGTHKAMGPPTLIGHIYPASDINLNACRCGCATRLIYGTQIAQEIRDELRMRLGITCCAGISYNKLLSKLVGACNKPNMQTVLVSTYAEQFMRELVDLQKVTGIGQKTQQLLHESNVTTIKDLQLCDMELLRKKFGFETATKLKDLAFGRDNSTVRPTGKPKSIGMEDSCKPLSVRTEVEDRFRLLLKRLVEQVAEDGRIPIAIKVVLRKFDPQKRSSHRESKQVNIVPSLFKIISPNTSKDIGNSKIELAAGAFEKLLKTVNHLFERIVDLNKPFHITLLGLAFSKFQERKVGSSSIANFLIKKTDLEVQSITSLTNTNINPATTANDVPTTSANATNDAFRSSPTTFKPSDQFYRRRATTASPVPMLLDNGSESAATNSDFSDISETEVEPSPKKSRIGRLVVSKRSRLADNNTDMATEVASPSKLRVCDLRLNSYDSDKDFPMSPITCQSTPTTNSHTTTRISRFRSIQRLETIGSGIPANRRFLTARTRTTSRLSSNASSTPSSPSTLPSPMDESPANTPTTPSSCTQIETNEQANTAETNTSELQTHTILETANINKGNSPQQQQPNVLSQAPCPAGVDRKVFNELPTDVQNELIASWRNSLVAAAAVTAVEFTNNAKTSPAREPVVAGTARSTTNSRSSDKNATQKNTLYHYFLRNK